MAFLKTVKNPHKPSENYENAYWYIVRIIADWCTNKAEVYLAVHIDSNKTGAPIQSYKVEIDNGVFAKVSWKEYWTIFAIQMTLILGVLGIIYAKLEKIDENGQSTKNVVQSIQGKLEPYDIIYKD